MDNEQLKDMTLDNAMRGRSKDALMGLLLMAQLPQDGVLEVIREQSAEGMALIVRDMLAIRDFIEVTAEAAATMHGTPVALQLEIAARRKAAMEEFSRAEETLADAMFANLKERGRA